MIAFELAKAILDKFGGSEKALDAHLFGQYKGLGSWTPPAMNMEKAARRQVKDTTAGKKFQAAEGSNECVALPQRVLNERGVLMRV